MFGNYCDPLLEHVFEPQNHRSNNNGQYFNPTSPMLVSILIGSPVVLAIVYVGILYIGRYTNLVILKCRDTVSMSMIRHLIPV